MEHEGQIAEPHLTMANEDYLECIVRIELEDDAARDSGIRSVEIAQRLDVSKASVNKAITSLKTQGMVEQAHYGKVRLTELGREIGAQVWRRHRMLRAFLTDELGVDFARADEEACRMEHALSDDTMDRWIAHMERSGVALGD
jgi:DtxR family Mn-dependent transcriptional regulator